MRLKDPHLPAASGPPSLLLFLEGISLPFAGSWLRLLVQFEFFLAVVCGHLTGYDRWRAGYDRWRAVSECPLSPFILGYLS